MSPLIGKIMHQICTDPTLCPEYPSSFGLPEFTRRATELVLGRDCHAIVENRVIFAAYCVCSMDQLDLMCDPHSFLIQ